MNGRWWRPVIAATVVAAMTGAIVTAAPLSSATPDGETHSCPALLTIAVQSVGEASQDTAPNTDSGILGLVLSPIIHSGDGVSFDRHYVRFDPVKSAVSSGSSKSPYEQSVEVAVAAVKQKTTEFLGRCRTSRIAVIGNADGAHVASLFARDVGKGSSGIDATKVAAVALIGDPYRNVGATVFPSSTGQTIPDPAPGTAGTAVKQLTPLTEQPATGGGIGATRDNKVSYGSLARRVASLCIAGDLTCDTPENAPILSVVSNLVATSADAGGNPLVALGSVAQALAFTVIKTATNVVNNDVSGTELQSVSLSSKTSMAARLAEASDPRTPLDLNNVLKAVMKVGTIAFNAVVTVAKSVLTVSNIAQLATAGLSNPAAGLTLLGQKLLSAVTELVTPATVINLVSDAFEAVSAIVTSNAGLLDTTTWVKYSDTLNRNGAYVNNPVSVGGDSSIHYVSDWLTAVSRDVATATATSTTARASTTTTQRTTTATTPTPTSTTGATSTTTTTAVVPTTPAAPTSTAVPPPPPLAPPSVVTTGGPLVSPAVS